MNWCNSHYMAELAWIWGCNSTGLPLAWGMGEGAGNKLPTGWLCWGRSWNSFLASFLVGVTLQPQCCRNPRAAPEQEHGCALVPSWAHFHHHGDNLSLLGLTDAPNPQWDSNHFHSPQNNHLAIIFPAVCLFLGSTSATLQSRTQSQHFPTAFKTSGTCKPL